MRAPTPPQGGGAAVNMTPMIDVVFLLIIFFLCVNQFQKVENDRSVRLPEASTFVPDDAEDRRRVVLDVLRDGVVRADGAVVGDVGPWLGARVEATGATEVWIRADRAVTYGRVSAILKAAAEAGVFDVAFKVDRAPGAGR